LRAIVKQALAEQPLECCGILAGETNGRVTRVFPTRNAAASAKEFVIDPEEQFAAFDAARADGLQIIGVYHSHPETPARPSEHDIRMAYADDWVYLIVSLAGDEVDPRAFRVIDGQPSQIPVDRRAGPAGAAGLASRADIIADLDQAAWLAGRAALLPDDIANTANSAATPR
jgi:proteasome lid subunit RPN8/RPN11